MRSLAQSLAAQGFPVLRVEPLGIGDSLDLEESENAWAIWQRGAEVARDFLRAQTGIDQVIMGGVRMGGRLAAEVTADGLVLLAPIASGRTWLRELKLAASVSDTLGPADAAGVESEGLTFSPRALEGLQSVDLANLAGDWKAALIFAQNPQAARVGARLTELGVNTQIHGFPGYEEFLRDTDSNRAPEAVFDLILTWAQETYPDLRTSRPVMTLPPCRLAGEAYEEISVKMAPGLIGLMTRARAPSGLGIIICSTSKEPRSGIGRLAVQIARDLAGDGVTTIRFDFSGVGDSEIDCDEHVYLADRNQELAQAADWLRQEGCTSVTVVGVCSGAFHALRAISTNPRLDKAYCVSSRLVWRGRDRVESQNWDQGAAIARYVAKLKNPETWWRLMRGKIDVRAVAGTLRDRLAQKIVAGLDSNLSAPLRNGMTAVSDRGGAVRLVMGLDDSSLDEVETYFGPRAKRLTRLPGMTIRVIEDLDHSLAKAASRAVILADLRAFLNLAEEKGSR
ncbi:MAG: hypothetical protein CGW95_00240 [Phenylobacterium zucineum]|nr:MAG: hypothetical protein CGW95_00240 [Phenylobacterium zucineum]